MTTLLFPITLIVLTISLIVMSMTIKHLPKEIDELKDSFEYHKKIHKYERLMAEQKNQRVHLSHLTNFEKSINKEENENQD